MTKILLTILLLASAAHAQLNNATRIWGIPITPPVAGDDTKTICYDLATRKLNWCSAGGVTVPGTSGQYLTSNGSSGFGTARTGNAASGPFVLDSSGNAAVPAGKAVIINGTVYWDPQCDGSTNIRAALQTMINTYSDIFITAQPGGVCLKDGTVITIPSNHAIRAAYGTVTLKVQTGATVAQGVTAFFTNSDWTNGNQFITIDGLILDGNNANVSYFGADGTDFQTGLGILFVRGGNYTLKNIYSTNTHRAHFMMASANDLYADNIECYDTSLEDSQDCYDIYGPSTRVTLSNFRGYANDDFIALYTNNFINPTGAYKGSITNVVMTNIEGRSTYHVFRFNSFNGVYRLDQIRATNVVGYLAGFMIDTDSGTVHNGAGNVGTIQIDNMDIDYASVLGGRIENLILNGYDGGPFISGAVVAPTVDQFIVNGGVVHTYVANTNQVFLVVQNGATYRNVRLSDLFFTDSTSTGAFSHTAVSTAGTGTVGTLSITNATIGQCGGVINTAGTAGITHAVLNNVACTMTGRTANPSGISMSNTAPIRTLRINNSVFTDGVNGILLGNSLGTAVRVQTQQTTFTGQSGSKMSIGTGNSVSLTGWDIPIDRTTLTCIAGDTMMDTTNGPSWCSTAPSTWTNMHP